MNILDYSIELGETIRNTAKGTELIQLNSEIEEKYKDNIAFRYIVSAKQKSAQYYFYAWDIAYKAFKNIHDNDSLQHKGLFLPTKEIIDNDEEISKLATSAASFGKIFEHIVSSILTGEDYKEVIPQEWNYTVKNAISNVQIATERTLVIKAVNEFYQKNPGQFDNEKTKEYLSEREKQSFLPFSNGSREFRLANSEVPENEKLLYEKVYLIIEAVKKGIFHGFWGILNEINGNDILDLKQIKDLSMQEVTLPHNADNDLFNWGWLYKINIEDTYLYFIAHNKEISICGNDSKSTISGILYPVDDIGLFEKC